MNKPLLYQAAVRGVFGKREEYTRSSITDALFVYLDGEPEPESVARVDSHFRVRPLVCLTGNGKSGSGHGIPTRQYTVER